MQGIAADIVVEGYSPAKIYQYLDQKYKGKYGIGEYPGWVHIDVRRGLLPVGGSYELVY